MVVAVGVGPRGGSLMDWGGRAVAAARASVHHAAARMLTVSAPAAKVLGLGGGPREGHELAGHDPVEVAVLHLLVVLVLFHVKLLTLVPFDESDLEGGGGGECVGVQGGVGRKGIGL